MGWNPFKAAKDFVSDTTGSVQNIDWGQAAKDYLVSPYYAAYEGYGDHQDRQAKSATDEQIAAEKARQKKLGLFRDGNLSKLREIYGIGDSTQAANNQANLAEMVRSYYQDVLGSNLRETDNRFANVSRVGRQNLARAGQLGGSLDANSQSGNLADYLRGRSRAVGTARDAKTSLTGKLKSQRLSAENQILQNPSANPDFNAFATNQASAIGEARSQIPQAAISNLFKVAGDTFYNGALDSANGNQGLTAFSSGRKSAGRTTGS